MNNSVKLDKSYFRCKLLQEGGRAMINRNQNSVKGPEFKFFHRKCHFYHKDNPKAAILKTK